MAKQGRLFYKGALTLPGLFIGTKERRCLSVRSRMWTCREPVCFGERAQLSPSCDCLAWPCMWVCATHTHTRSCQWILGPQTGGPCSVLPSTVFFPSLHTLPLFSPAGPPAMPGPVPLIWVSLTLSRRSQSLISRAGGHQQRAARPIIGPSPPVSRETADVSASNLLFTHEARRPMGLHRENF